MPPALPIIAKVAFDTRKRPEHLYLQCWVLPPEPPEPGTEVLGEQLRPHGKLLSTYLEKFGGPIGTMLDPWGGQHELDLQPWLEKGHGPDSIVVVVFLNPRQGSACSI